MQLAAVGISNALGAMAAAPITTAATLVGGYAAYQGAQAQNKANLANANAIGVESQQVQQQGLQAEVKTREKAAAIAGEEAAGYAASGIDTGSGTGADVINETKQLGNMDAMTVRSNTLSQMNVLKNQQNALISSYQNPMLAARKTILSDLAISGLGKDLGDAWNKAWKTQILASAGTAAMNTYQGTIPSYVPNLA